MQREPERRHELTAFLRSLRARTKPHEARLGGDARRRVPGLRREEVAELIGISDVWYARCESGRARFSLAALDRLAKELTLDEAERRRLFSLARPELGSTTASAAHDEFATLGSSLSEFNRFARTLTSCSSSADFGEAAVRSLDCLVDAKGMSYWGSCDGDGGMLFEATCGHKAESMYGYRQPAGAIPHVEDRLLGGEFVFECDLTQSPSSELRERVARVGAYSYFGRGIARSGETLDHIFGFARFERHEPTPLERQISELVATMIELALR